jgi:predicted secreted protein
MAKMSAFKTKIAWDSAGGSSFTEIAQVRAITPPSISRSEIDVTTHDSPNGWMEYIKGLKDGGEISFEIIFDPSLGTHDAITGLLSDFNDDTSIANWRIIFPDTANTTWTTLGFLTGFEADAPTDDALTASITIKVTGQPTLA